jgi:hypothetical protein
MFAAIRLASSRVSSLAAERRSLIVVKSFDNIGLAPGGFPLWSSQLKGPPNGGVLFAFRSVQDCNSPGSFAIFAAIRCASSLLSNLAGGQRWWGVF